jgi:similar to stage IV sporulation protein
VVRRGQLLISGVTDDVQAGTRFLRGMGKVYARTWYSLRCHVSGEKREKQYTGEEKVRVALCWGRRRMNLCGGEPEGDWEKQVERKQLALPGGLLLPLTVVKETFRAYKEESVSRSREEAEKLAKISLDAYLLAGMEEGGVEQARYAAVLWEGDWLVGLEAECYEQIGRFQPLQTEGESTS